jgi:hypothetical protein
MRALLGIGLIGLSLPFLLLACGGGLGSPGSTGSEDTNVLWEAQIEPELDGQVNVNTISAPDTQIANCPGGNIDALLHDHMAEVSLTARKIHPELPAGTQHIEGYRIQYSSSDPNAPPLSEFSTQHSVDVALTNSDSAQATFTAYLVPIEQKQEFYWASTDYSYFPVYTATYTFYGQDSYGNDFSFKASTSFTIGYFEECRYTD